MSELLILPAQSEINERVRWLIRWRWLAIIAAFVVIFSANAILSNTLAVGPLVSVTVSIAIYNLLLYVYVKRLDRYDVAAKYQQFLVVAHVQKILDLLAFTLLIHFAGGLENPFAFIYIIPIVLASLFFSRKVSLLYVGLAMLLFVGLILLESNGVLNHYNLVGYRSPVRYTEVVHIFSVSLALFMALFFTSYFVSFPS